MIKHGNKTFFELKKEIILEMANTAKEEMYMVDHIQKMAAASKNPFTKIEWHEELKPGTYKIHPTTGVNGNVDMHIMPHHDEEFHGKHGPPKAVTIEMRHDSAEARKQKMLHMKELTGESSYGNLGYFCFGVACGRSPEKPIPSRDEIKAVYHPHRAAKGSRRKGIDDLMVPTDKDIKVGDHTIKPDKVSQRDLHREQLKDLYRRKGVIIHGNRRGINVMSSGSHPDAAHIQHTISQLGLRHTFDTDALVDDGHVDVRPYRRAGEDKEKFGLSATLSLSTNHKKKNFAYGENAAHNSINYPGPVVVRPPNKPKKEKQNASSN